MRKQLRTRAKLVLFGIFAVGFMALFAWSSKEPSFEGRSLRDWICTMNKQPPGAEKEKSRAVVRRLGSRSIPLLLKWLQEEDRPSLTGRFDALRHSVFFWLVGHQIIPNRSIVSLRDDNTSHSAMAGWALAELDNASRTNVIPALIQMLGDTNHRPEELSRAAGGAFMVLPTLAPESIAPLTEALSNKDVQAWSLAAGALGRIGPAAKSAIPSLEKGLKDARPFMRVGAAETIDQIGGDPKLFLPAVIESLPDVYADMDVSLKILLRHTKEAKAAVPALVRILNQTRDSNDPTNSTVHYEVMQALRSIAPDAVVEPRAE